MLCERIYQSYLLGLLIYCFLLLASCGNDEENDSNSSSGCTIDENCNDRIDCTEDSCTDSGLCRNIVVPARCPSGQVCDLSVGGCRAGTPCATSEDCDDDDPCTQNERCDPSSRVCLFEPLDGDRDGYPPGICGGKDCDDSNLQINPGSPEYCNGLDDDCDGRIDNNLFERCGANKICEEGNCICAPNITVCNYSDCCSENQICCESGCSDLTSDDDNCGECGANCLASESCVEGECQCFHSIELCDGLDNDCDGVIDNNLSENVCEVGEICISVRGRCLPGSPTVMILSGPFMMGGDSTHEVNVPDFEIDVTEVTVKQYRVCVEDSGSCSRATFAGSGIPIDCNSDGSYRLNHPVNCVLWPQAKEYCEWVGKRLCSESEWEKAARGTDGRIYPWGDEPPTCERAIMAQGGSAHTGCDEERTWPVGSKPAGMHGLYDMAGNVWEWVEDDFGSYENTPDNGEAWIEDPRSSMRIIRGGSFYSTSDSSHLRTFDRSYGRLEQLCMLSQGIRCCRDAP